MPLTGYFVKVDWHHTGESTTCVSQKEQLFATMRSSEGIMPDRARRVVGIPSHQMEPTRGSLSEEACLLEVRFHASGWEDT